MVNKEDLPFDNGFVKNIKKLPKDTVVSKVELPEKSVTPKNSTFKFGAFSNETVKTLLEEAKKAKLTDFLPEMTIIPGL